MKFDRHIFLLVYLYCSQTATGRVIDHRVGDVSPAVSIFHLSITRGPTPNTATPTSLSSHTSKHRELRGVDGAPIAADAILERQASSTQGVVESVVSDVVGILDPTPSSAPTNALDVLESAAGVAVSSAELQTSLLSVFAVAATSGLSKALFGTETTSTPTSSLSTTRPTSSPSSTLMSTTSTITSQPTTSSTSSPTTSSSSTMTLSTTAESQRPTSNVTQSQMKNGTIAGIATGSVAGIVLLALLVVLFWRWRKSKGKPLLPFISRNASQRSKGVYPEVAWLYDPARSPSRPGSAHSNRNDDSISAAAPLNPHGLSAEELRERRASDAPEAVMIVTPDPDDRSARSYFNRNENSPLLTPMPPAASRENSPSGSPGGSPGRAVYNQRKSRGRSRSSLQLVRPLSAVDEEHLHAQQQQRQQRY